MQKRRDVRKLVRRRRPSNRVAVRGLVMFLEEKREKKQKQVKMVGKQSKRRGTGETKRMREKRSGYANDFGWRRVTRDKGGRRGGDWRVSK